ncbi:galactokinase [bacterium]|nr:galactokinase [bacterium]
MTLHDRVVTEFRRRFGVAPAAVVRAPGRVNLIGEHTDYNEGFVLPMTLDRATWIALQARPDRQVNLHSLNHDQTTTLHLDALAKAPGRWAEYPKAVAWALQEAGYSLAGWDGVTDCDVPIGAGLSSSASFELAVARAFAAVSGFSWDPAVMARLGQHAENQWVGVNCGIMDQMISAAGQAGHALLIDCRSLATRAVPLPAGTAVVVLDTATRRGLVGSAYNERRAQCEAAARFFGVAALRDVSAVQFEANAGRLDELIRRRARHVVTENDRTVHAAAAMADDDPLRLGQLMNASHESLRTDFEVTNRELDAMVECARASTACLGARMTGAGFGGCAVALVRAGAVAGFMAATGQGYRERTGLTPHLYVCRPTNGAEVV